MCWLSQEVWWPNPVGGVMAELGGVVTHPVGGVLTHLGDVVTHPIEV